MKSMDKRKKDILYNVILVLLAVVFLGSGGSLVADYLQKQRQEKALDEIAAIFPEETMPVVTELQVPETEQVPETNEENDTAVSVISPKQWKLQWEQIATGRFASYRELQLKNPDMVGWVRIEGTKIDYPVLQTPEDPEYYLRRDFNRQSSSYGIPFMEAECRYEEPRTNLMIYGHHMRNGSMFAALNHYTEKSFYQKHPYIQFDTMDHAGSYEIVSVVKVDASGNQTPWNELLFPSDEEHFLAAWNIFQNQQFYDTGVELQYTDRLLALVTCEYTLKDGRIMVVAREIR